MSSQRQQIRNILWQHLLDSRTSVSVGSYGAIAEFHRRADEALQLDDERSLCVASSRGGIRVHLETTVLALAFETLSRRPGRWQHGVAFCLAEQSATRSRRQVLTELGPDTRAIWPKHRGDILFDLGLHARNIDFCIRTSEPALLRALRKASDTRVLDPEKPIMAVLLSADPHRVVLSALARAEVYQPIGREVTPEGPHTHVLPKLLKTGRTHSANVPIPAGLRPCLMLHPSNPLFDAMGEPKPFEAGSFTEFSKLLDHWGLSAYQREKRRVTQAISNGLSPLNYREPSTRLGRTALRVALRQLCQVTPDDPAIRRWIVRFDKRQANATASGK